MLDNLSEKRDPPLIVLDAHHPTTFANMSLNVLAAHESKQSYPLPGTHNPPAAAKFSGETQENEFSTGFLNTSIIL
jgi:hypothetical protein